MGDVGVFSFFPSKNLGGFGDGGAVTAKNPELFRKIKMLSNHGREKKYWHELEGINSRLDSLQAALLRVCLPHLDQWNAHRRQVAAWYKEELAGVEQIKLPSQLENTDPVYHVYVVVVPDREDLAEFLKEKGVATGVHYPYSLNLLPAYAHLNQGAGCFPRAEYACAHMLSLPMSPVLTRDEIKYVGDCIKEYFNR
jgi:dTDP-4-amino-4,6-dideoxygalactose transaminase